MEVLQKKVKILLIFGCIAVSSFILGVPVIVGFAIKNQLGLMVIGIVMVVFGFYGTPLFWTFYGLNLSKLKMLDLILNEGLRSVGGIASRRNALPMLVRKNISSLMEKGYLKDFTFDGEELVKKGEATLKNNVGKKNGARCGSCNAYVVFKGEQSICPYCGRLLEGK